jgi:hypothetical protein
MHTCVPRVASAKAWARSPNRSSSDSGASRPSAAHVRSEAQNVQVGVPAPPNHEECLTPAAGPSRQSPTPCAARARPGEQNPNPVGGPVYLRGCFAAPSNTWRDVRSARPCPKESHG